MTHISVSTLIIIGSDNGLSPDRRQAIIWTNAGILLIGPLGTNFSEILIEIYTFSFRKMHLKMPFRKWRPFCLGLDVLLIGQSRVYQARIRAGQQPQGVTCPIHTGEIDFWTKHVMKHQHNKADIRYIKPLYNGYFLALNCTVTFGIHRI